MYAESVITNAGARLIEQWTLGGKLTIERAAAGSGTSPADTLATSTTLKNELYELSIISKKRVDSGVEIHLRFQQQEQSYKANQVGLWAKLEGGESDGQSVLFAIYQDNAGFEIPSTSEMKDFRFEFYAPIAVSNAGNIEITIDPQAYVTREDIAEIEAEVKAVADEAQAQAQAAIKDINETTATAKQEVETMLDGTASEVEGLLNRAALPSYPFTIPAEGWEPDPDNGGLNSISVSVEGIAVSDKVAYLADMIQSGTEETDALAREGWTMVTRMVASAGQVTVYALEPPETEIQAQVIALEVKEGTGRAEIMMLRRGGSGVNATNIEDAQVTLDHASYTYDKASHAPKVTAVELRGKPLTEWKDYVYISTPGTTAGSYSVIVMGIVEYGGVCNVPWTIDKAQNTIKAEPSEVSVTGKMGTTKDVTLTYEEDGEVTVSEDEYVTSKVDGRKITLTSVQEGQTELTITVGESANYAQTTLQLPVTVKLVSDTLEENDWDVIASVAAEGKAEEFWNVGDKKAITINGETYHAQIIGFGHDDLDSTDAKYSDSSYNGGKKKAAITFQMEEIYSQTYRMDETNSNDCSWRDSEMRTQTMPIIKGLMEPELVAVMRTVTKKTAHNQSDSTLYSTADELFLLAAAEVFDNPQYVHPGEGTRYAYYAAENSRVKMKSGAASWWWLRSPSTDTNGTFRSVSTDGSYYASGAYSTGGGLAASFCV